MKKKSSSSTEIQNLKYIYMLLMSIEGKLAKLTVLANSTRQEHLKDADIKEWNEKLITKTPVFSGPCLSWMLGILGIYPPIKFLPTATAESQQYFKSRTCFSEKLSNQRLFIVIHIRNQVKMILLKHFFWHVDSEERKVRGYTFT